MRIGAFGFGSWIAVTSAAGIYFGVDAWNGWLAILYGLLGIAMGVGGTLAPFVRRPLRSALFGWCLGGIALRAVMEGGLYGWIFSFPIATVLLLGLMFELIAARSIPNLVAGLGGGALATVALVLLAIAAPSLPVMCPSTFRNGVSILYPPDGFPWDAVEYHYLDVCMTRLSTGQQ